MKTFGLFYDSGWIMTETVYGDMTPALVDARFWAAALGVGVNIWSSDNKRLFRAPPANPLNLNWKWDEDENH